MESTFNLTNKLEAVLKICIEKGFSFVTYRLPKNTGISTFVQYSKPVVAFQDINSIEGKQGFVVAPFDSHSGHPVYLIQPDIIISGNNFDSQLINELAKSDSITKVSVNTENSELINIADFDEYKNQVLRTIQTIKNGDAKKIVISRIEYETRAENISYTRLFKTIEEEYTEAFVYLLFTPGTGLWCGASPESLVSVSNGIISTVALAATRKCNKFSELKPWDEKEIEEQAIVTQYIESVLERFSVKKITKSGPEPQQAGNIAHLKTTFTFPEKELNGHFFDFINELHPTPAVCGLPKINALQIISQIEKHHREYYSGYLGPVNTSGETNLFVNLRCMKIFRSKFALYLGAGITEASDPEKELEETNLKKLTLLNIIKRINHPANYDG